MFDGIIIGNSSPGSGTIPTLQQVCDAGNTTTTKINATNGSAILSSSDDGNTAVGIKTASDGSSQSLSFQQPDYLSNLIVSEFVDNYNWSLPNKTGTIALLENLLFTDATIPVAIGDTIIAIPPNPSLGQRIISLIPKNTSSAIILQGGYYVQVSGSNYQIVLIVPSTIADDCEFNITSYIP